MIKPASLSSVVDSGNVCNVIETGNHECSIVTSCGCWAGGLVDLTGQTLIEENGNILENRAQTSSVRKHCFRAKTHDGREALSALLSTDCRADGLIKFWTLEILNREVFSRKFIWPSTTDYKLTPFPRNIQWSTALPFYFFWHKSYFMFSKLQSPSQNKEMCQSCIRPGSSVTACRCFWMFSAPNNITHSLRVRQLFSTSMQTRLCAWFDAPVGNRWTH